MNYKKRSVTRLFTSIVLLLLAACTSTEKVADITAQPTESAQAYLQLAETSNDIATSTNWTILALKASIIEKNSAQTEQLLSKISKKTLSLKQQAEWQIARAQNETDAQTALKDLNFNSSWKLAKSQWARYYALRASLFEGINDYFNADRELINSRNYRLNTAQKDISENIWQNITSYSASELNQLKPSSKETELKGWIYLASDFKANISKPTQLSANISNWLLQNPSHAAAISTPESLQKIIDLDLSQPTNVAILLPLSGKYKGPANIIRDGFFHALSSDKSRDSNAKFTAYDTQKDSLESIYAKLQANGTDLIVGPLIKDNIGKLDTLNKGAIPALALNFPQPFVAYHNVCYLTLSPEIEVAQGAKHISEKGYKYPLVLAPKGTVGTRVVTAFEKSWKEYSNTPVASAYLGTKSELRSNIKKAFALTKSQDRYNQIKQLTGTDLNFQPSSRGDIDVVYVTANQSELSLIKPLIDISIAPGKAVPKVYTNSSSNDGELSAINDIRGVSFSDIPLILEPTGSVKAELNEFWPNYNNSEKRLHALGMDAYTLQKNLSTVMTVPELTISGQTGGLSVDDNCAVQRELSWSTYGAVSNDSTDDSDNADVSDENSNTTNNEAETAQ